MSMENHDLQSLVGRQYTTLADLLAEQPATIADLPSLCDGWAMKNVVAHLTMAVRYDRATFLQELAAAGNSFPVLSDKIAGRDGELPFSDLVEDLRSETMARWAPPGGGAIGALSHVVIHGLDITSAVDLPRTADDEATRIVLDALVGGVSTAFGIEPAQRTLRTLDLDWRSGSGPLAEATAADLVLALAGRPRPLPGLSMASPARTS
jgi:uncharacterized protein (TIGR03083 family)